MAYDEELAARVRELITAMTAFEERTMFGVQFARSEPPTAGRRT